MKKEKKKYINKRYIKKNYTKKIKNNIKREKI